MKLLDRYLRDVRIAKARKFLQAGDVVLDVGCADGAMFEQCGDLIRFGTGIDADLEEPVERDSFELVPGFFPDTPLGERRYSAITMLAVLEHLPAEKRAGLAAATHAVMEEGGRLIITVPSPRVDGVLHVLERLRLVDGMHVEEHHGFDPSETEGIFREPWFRLTAKEKFQFGLNNLFVFEALPVVR